MRKIAILIFFVITATVFAPYSFAQTSTPSSIREQKLQLRDQRLEEKKALLEERSSDRQANLEQKKVLREAQLTQKRTERISYFWGLLRRRLLAAAERLEKLIERIESRLAKIEEVNEDVDLDDINAQVLEAKEMLTAVMTNIEAADVEVETALTSQEPKEAFGTVRSLVKEIKTDLIEIHRKLVHLIGDMKGLRVGQGASPSSAVTPTEVPTTATPTPTVEVTLTPTVVPTGGV